MRLSPHPASTFQPTVGYQSARDTRGSALGAKVHKLPTGPDQVPSDGEFRYVILGPGGQSESGNPSALAVRFCDEVTGPQNPRAAKNAIVITAPDRTGIAQAQEKVKERHCWIPRGRVRRLLTRLGCERLEGPPDIDQSTVIADFVARHLGTRGIDFCGDYDLPLQIVTRDKHAGALSDMLGQNWSPSDAGFDSEPDTPI